MDKHTHYIRIAKEISMLSKCNRLKVGALIIGPDSRPKSWGYNGTPIGTSNECEEDGVTRPEVLHAEINAILHSTGSLAGASLYVTHSPCIHCSAMIIQVGITCVYYKEAYRKQDGIEYLTKHGVECHQIQTD